MAGHETLSIWTIYDNPSDFPGKFVARRFVVYGATGPLATPEVFEADSLDEIRAMIPQGLFRMEPWQGDDIKIVETWI